MCYTPTYLCATYPAHVLYTLSHVLHTYLLPTSHVLHTPYVLHTYVLPTYIPMCYLPCTCATYLTCAAYPICAAYLCATYLTCATYPAHVLHTCVCQRPGLLLKKMFRKMFYDSRDFLRLSGQPEGYVCIHWYVCVCI